MKKFMSLVILVLVSVTLTACGGSADGKEISASSNIKIDTDLSLLSNTMVTSELFNMITKPEDYNGKTVKISGQFSAIEKTTKDYSFAVIIAGADACCSQGVEFVMKEDLKYPDDYPLLGAGITVVGTFETYEKDGYIYGRIVDAVIE